MNLMRRMIVTGLHPCAMIAVVLAVLLTWSYVRNLAQAFDASAAIRIGQLAPALEAAPADQQQRLLEHALDESSTVPLQGIRLKRRDGSVLKAERPERSSATADYPQALRGNGWLNVTVDRRPLLEARRVACLIGMLAAIGIVLLALLYGTIMHRHINLRLRHARRLIEALLDSHASPTLGPTKTSELKLLGDTVAQLVQHTRRREAEYASSRRGHDRESLERLHQVQAAVRGKSQFIAQVGHHFRQPLQALQLFVAGLQDSLDLDVGSARAGMRKSISTMTQLLDALTEISRLDAGVVPMQPAHFSAVQLFGHERWLVAHAAQQGVQVVWRSSRHTMCSDQALVARLLHLLLINAIAHAPNGRVLVAVRRRGDDVRVEVRDNGIGIAPLHRQRIFDEFVQLEDRRNHRPEGYGLGLAIAARIAALLGTRIELRSELGQGSTFAFALPSAATVSQPPRPAPVPMHQTA